MLNAALSLVVILVIDQFRTDELFRARPLLGRQGILKLVNEGVFYDDAHHANFFNMTCVGHAAVSTGATPQLSGILMNREYDRRQKKAVYCVEDPSHKWIDAEADASTVEIGTSAARLKVTTVGDEMKLLWGDETKVVAVAEKDRAAILLGGHLADHVYFHAPKSRLWTSSTAYIRSGKLPDWLVAYNKAFHARPVDGDYDVSPRNPEDTADIALQIAQREKLGLRRRPDLLAVSFSAHDHVGHERGDDSKELDAMMRAEDAAIARLIAGLRKQLGERRFKSTLFVLTADHGASPNMTKVLAKGLPGGQVGRSEMEKALSDCLQEPGAVLFAQSTGIYLNDKIAGDAALLEKAKACLQAQPSILRALTRVEIQAGQYPQQTHWGRLLGLNFPGQGGPDLVGVLNPYWGTAKSPTSHETPHAYDSWVPLALWSPRFKAPLKIHRPVEVTSLAPTLARLLETRRPSGAQGPYLEEILKAFE